LDQTANLAFASLSKLSMEEGSQAAPYLAVDQHPTTFSASFAPFLC
jgi:hypothetical protein